MLKTRADNQELRIWYEPASVHLVSGQQSKVRVIAEFSNNNNLLTNLQVQIQADGNLNVYPQELTYVKPFRGKVHIGDITVNASETGVYTLQTTIVSAITAKQEQISTNIVSAEIIVE